MAISGTKRKSRAIRDSLTSLTIFTLSHRLNALKFVVGTPGLFIHRLPLNYGKAAERDNMAMGSYNGHISWLNYPHFQSGKPGALPILRILPRYMQQEHEQESFVDIMHPLSLLFGQDAKFMTPIQAATFTHASLHPIPSISLSLFLSPSQAFTCNFCTQSKT